MIAPTPRAVLAVLPPGKHPLRRAVLRAVEHGCDAVAHLSAASAAHGQARAADAEHDQRLEAAHRHLLATLALLAELGEAPEAVLARRHVRATLQAVLEAQSYDRDEDAQVDLMAALVRKARDGWRRLNAALDGLLVSPKRPAAVPTTLEGV